jgi:(1->4)-alpha-D-glucan 1-alpha-D-glucosylmutase
LPGRVEPLVTTGPAAGHLVSLVRGGRAASLATRLPLRLAEAGGWRTTTVDLPGRWSDRLSGARWEGEVRVADVLASLPVALLVRETGGEGGAVASTAA